METEKRLPKSCPSCGKGLRVHTMHCTGCGTKIEGDYKLPPLMRLAEEDLQFVHNFILCGGSLKEIASRMGLSYPTVRNRLDDIIEQLNKMML
ncbi:MAG: DUF2089 family protein [Alistipes sp.]|nr:DUF2089 family protein [Alistipes sp.]